MAEVEKIDPWVTSRAKASLLSEALGKEGGPPLPRKEVYRLADLCEISLGQARSHEEMWGPRRGRIELCDADMDDVVQRLAERSSTMGEIADDLGICPKTLQTLMRGAGIRSRWEVCVSDDDVADAILELRSIQGNENSGATFFKGARTLPPS